MIAWRCQACGLVNWIEDDDPPNRCYAHPNNDTLDDVTFERLSASEVAAHRGAGGLAIFAVRKTVGPILCPHCRGRTTRRKLADAGMCGSCDTAMKRGDPGDK